MDAAYEWYWDVFNRLSTSRVSTGHGVSPISYLAVVGYANDLGLSMDTRELLWDVIKGLDAVFLKAVAEQLRRANPPRPPPRR